MGEKYSNTYDNVVFLSNKVATMNLLTIKELQKKYPDYDFWDEKQIEIFYQGNLLDGEQKSTTDELRILEESYLELVEFRKHQLENRGEEDLKKT